jgi:uncharacterized protein (TIGR02118 family)
MIKVSVMYPYAQGKKFNLDYYLKNHMPMVAEKLGGALKKMSVDSGVGGGTPGSSPSFVAMGHLYFDSQDAFNTSFGPHTQEIMGDIPNYTDITPTIQVSEVKL